MHLILSIIGLVCSFGTTLLFNQIILPKFFRTKKFNHILEDLISEDVASLIFRLEITSWFEAFDKMANAKTRNQLLRTLQRGFRKGSYVEQRALIVGQALGNLATMSGKARQRAIKLTIMLSERHQNYDFIVGLLDRNKNIKTRVFLQTIRTINNPNRDMVFRYMGRDQDTARLLVML